MFLLYKNKKKMCSLTILEMCEQCKKNKCWQYSVGAVLEQFVLRKLVMCSSNMEGWSAVGRRWRQ